MNNKPDRAGRASPARFRDFDVAALATWLLGFGLVSWLGLSGGGFDAQLIERTGVYTWWIIFAGLCMALLPARRLGTLAWLTLGLLAAFTLWTALSLSWTGSPDKTSVELARVATYLGVFGLAIFARSSRSARRMTSAVAAAIVLIATVALVSRLHPAWFPEAAETGKVLVDEAKRLSYPIGYWNGLGALLAIGLSLLLNTASTAESVVARSVSTAGIPVLLLTLYFTLSRGSFLAVGLGLAAYFVLVPDRIPKFATLLAGAIGGAVLICIASQKTDLADGLLNSAAQNQGTTVLILTIIVVVLTGAIHSGVSKLLARRPRPAWSKLSRVQTLVGVGGTAAVLLVALLALGAPVKVSDSWTDFKSAESVSDSTTRLESASGNGRYQYWSAAINEMKTRPLTGTGAGTFEYWWGEHGDRPGFIRDTHSLYFQTLGELGIIGLLLLAALLLTILIGGARATIQASVRRRPQLAAAAAGCLTFCISAAFDWIWQVPVLPLTMLLLASVLVTAETHQSRKEGSPYSWPPRIAMSAGCLVAIVAISIPLASGIWIEQSQSEFRSGDSQTALNYASKADSAQPAAAEPNLQMALLLEQMGDLEAARHQARRATEDEPVNWRNWLVLSRIEAKSGRVDDSVTHFRIMMSLRP